MRASGHTVTFDTKSAGRVRSGGLVLRESGARYRSGCYRNREVWHESMHVREDLLRCGDSPLRSIAQRQREVTARQAMQVQLGQQLRDLGRAPLKQREDMALEAGIEPAHARAPDGDRSIRQRHLP